MWNNVLQCFAETYSERHCPSNPTSATWYTEEYFGEVFAVLHNSLGAKHNKAVTQSAVLEFMLQSNHPAIEVVPCRKHGNSNVVKLHKHNTSNSRLHRLLCKLVCNFPAHSTADLRGCGGEREGGMDGIRTAAAERINLWSDLGGRLEAWLKLSPGMEWSWNALDGKVIRHCGGLPVVHHTAPSDQRESSSLAWQPTAHSRQMYI